MLSTQQIEQYRTDGMVVVPCILDEPTRLRMKAVLADLVEASRTVTAHTEVYDLEPGHTALEPRVRRIKKPRGLLLYEVTAGDAFPLMGAGNFDDFKSRLLFGENTIEPRFRPAPVRMPLPPAKNQGSIYENQTAGKRYFGFMEKA